MSRRFRDIMLLTLMSTLVLLIAHLMEFFLRNELFYKIFEISALLLFLISTSLLLVSYFQQEKESKKVFVYF